MNKTDCSDLNLETPFVQNLDDISLTKKLKLAKRNKDIDLIIACNEEIESRKIYKLRDLLSDFISDIELILIQGKPVDKNDLKMFKELIHFYDPVRRHMVRHMLHYSKKLGREVIIDMVDRMIDLREQDYSSEEIKLAIDKLLNYQQNKESF